MSSAGAKKSAARTEKIHLSAFFMRSTIKDLAHSREHGKGPLCASIGALNFPESSST
jgi:hypothetical protein